MSDPVLVFAPMSKETASDLKTYIDRSRRAALELDRATLANDHAERVLSEFIWQLQQAPKVPGCDKGLEIPKFLRKCPKCGTVVTCDCGIPDGGKS